MVTASLRKANTPPQVITETHEVNGVHIPSTTTVAAPAPDNAGLENLVPKAAEDPSSGKPSNPETAIVKRPDSAVAVPRNFAPGDGFEGDWGAEDLKFPQFKLVQGSGPMSAIYDQGTVIYGDAMLQPPQAVNPGAPVQPPIRFIPIAIQKQFREKLSEEASDEGQMPRIFNSRDEVEEAGLTTRWVYGQPQPPNYAEDSARCLFLIERPEGNDHPGFALELDGKLFGAAVYYAAGGAFRESAKTIFNAAQSSLLVPVLNENGKPKLGASGQIIKKPLIYKNFWTISFAKKPAGKFMVYRPIVKLLAKETTSDAIREYCASLTTTSAEE